MTDDVFMIEYGTDYEQQASTARSTHLSHSPTSA
jgi:hypothetical protein